MAGTSSIEREIKLEADERLDLEQLGGEPLERRVFTSTYHDTPDLLLALIGELEEPPPLLKAETGLDDVARKELRKLRKTMARIDESAPDELLHKARIRAKRLRYVAEVLGEKRVVRRAKQLQDVAGEHQDAVVAEERLRDLAARASESTLALGRLVERQSDRRMRSRDALGKTWKRLERAAAAAWA